MANTQYIISTSAQQIPRKTNVAIGYFRTDITMLQHKIPAGKMSLFMVTNPTSGPLGVSYHNNNNIMIILKLLHPISTR